MHKEVKRAGARIGLGSTVTLAAPDGGGKTVKFTVVERREVDAARGSVFEEAPIARAVIGHEVAKRSWSPRRAQEASRC